MNIILKSLPIFSVFYLSIPYCYSTNHIEEDEYVMLRKGSDYSVSSSLNNTNETSKKRERYRNSEEYESNTTETDATICSTNRPSDNSNNYSLNNLHTVDNNPCINYINDPVKENTLSNSIIHNDSSYNNKYIISSKYNKCRSDKTSTDIAYNENNNNDKNEIKESNTHTIKNTTNYDKLLQSIAKCQGDNKQEVKYESNQDNNCKYF